MATWSIKSSGGDFTSISAAAASGSVTAGDTLSVDEAFNAQSSTWFASKSLIVTAGAAYRPTSPTRAAAAAAARMEVSGAAVESDCDLTLTNLAVIDTGGTARAILVDNIAARTCTFANLVILDSQRGIQVRSGNTATIYNCASISPSVVGFLSNGTTDAYQCSVLADSGGYGFYRDAGTFNAYACVAQGSGGGANCFDGSGGSLTGEDNVSADNSALGSNVRKSITGIFKNVSGGSEDLNLYGLNGGLLTGVTDRSGTVAGLATDLAGNSRPLATNFPIDPGCVQIASGPSILAYADIGNIATAGPMTLSINPPKTNTLLVAVISVSGDTLSAGNPTFNSTAMTTGTGADQNNAGFRTYVGYLQNPSTGSHTLSAAFGGGFSRGWMAAYVLAFAGDSNSPAIDVGDGTTFNNVATSASKSTTTAVANEGAVDIWANPGSGSAPVPDSPQVSRAKSANVSFHEAATSARLAVSAASTSDGWTFNAGAAGALSVVYIKPGGAAPADPGTITSMLSLMGVG